ncbi:MAG: efflux RND transporter permease subunit, partial [Chloroflexota bacterium]
MRSFFDLLTRLALRFRALTLAIVVVIMTLGGIAATELQQELLPPIEFPQRFVLIQVSGMTSEEVLNVVTLRVEDEVAAVPGVVNVESQTSSNIGVFLLVSTQFGLDQDEIAADIQDALNSVYFPGRLIEPAEGQSVEALSTQLMGDLPADVPLYLFSSNPSLMYQLTPEVWASLSDETAMTLLQFLATETNTPSGDTSALELLVDAEIVPQLEALIRVARVDIEGGQALPGESAPGMEPVNASEFIEPESLLLQLPPESWDVLAERFDLGELNQATVDSLINENITIPANAPALPESWQAFAGFTDATDLAEMASFTRTSASVFNNFVENGEIRGALGTTEDLTVEDVQAMLEIEPNLANYFDGEQLAAMPPEVVDVLEEYVELDGLSRDALAASLLARDLTGDVTLGEPERLPAPWRLNPPEIISFSFADLPLATFSVFSTATPGTQEDMPDDATTAESTDADNTDTSEDSATANPADAFTIGENPAFADAPEGPPLPELYGVFAEFFNYELDTADDLLRMQFPPEIEPLLGGTDGAAFLNLLPQIGQLLTALGGDADSGDAAVPEFGIAQIGQLTGALVDCNINSAQLLAGGELNFGPIGTGMIACLEPAVFEYLSENDPAFGSRLSPEVYANLSPEVFAIDGYAPLLGDPWQSLGDRPEFADQPLRNADNLIALGDGNAAQVLNTINDEITGQFVGYEVRLFDSLSVPAIDYIATNDTDFYSNLSSDVLLKFSPDVLANLPDSALDNFDADTVAQAQAIADGSAESAAAQIASEYESDIAEARPEAPELNDQWDQIAGFYGVELNNAFDLIRFESVLGGPPATFINNLFASPNGASFAPALLGNMPLDAFTYIADEDPNFIPNLEPRALNLLSEEVFNSLPEETQERAAAGEVFVPSTQVTRTNGAPSLLVTIFKTSDANTVTAFAEVERIINEIDANNDAIEVEVAFEQASFIEESISGVVVSGLLGAF